MKIGVLLPTFRTSPEGAFAAAELAERAGLDGVFAYDHLWPMGTPERPALAPFAVLSAVARRHESLSVAPLVARIGLVGTEHLVEQFETLEALYPGRVIAALGTGDRLSAAENEAYGLALQSAQERRALLGEAARRLRARMPVWIGGGASSTNDLARELGVAINLWDANVERVREVAALGPVTWAGPEPEDLDATLDALSTAGATWAVLSPQVDIARLAQWRARS